MDLHLYCAFIEKYRVFIYRILEEYMSKVNCGSLGITLSIFFDCLNVYFSDFSNLSVVDFNNFIM